MPDQTNMPDDQLHYVPHNDHLRLKRIVRRTLWITLSAVTLGVVGYGVR